MKLKRMMLVTCATLLSAGLIFTTITNFQAVPDGQAHMPSLNMKSTRTNCRFSFRTTTAPSASVISGWLNCRKSLFYIEL